MSLVGRSEQRGHRWRNPQHGMTLWGTPPAVDEVDDRRTPRDLFEPLHLRHSFTVDAAASDVNHQLPRYWTIADDGLAQSWAGERVWCNPPYSQCLAWAEKAHAETAALVVMLLPANRTEQRWWQSFVEPYRDRGGRLTAEFLPRRIEFSRPDLERVHVPFGCVLLTWTSAA